MERKGKDQHNSIIISGYFMLVCNTNFMCACEMERGREYGYEDRDSVLYVLVECVVKIHATYMHVERSQTMNAYTAPETEHRWCACHCIVSLARFSLSSNDTGNILCIDCMSLTRLSHRNKRFKCPKFNWNRHKIHTHSAMR